jgi:hypothetical protein
MPSQACSKPCCRKVPNQPCLTALYLGDVVARSPAGTDAREIPWPASYQSVLMRAFQLFGASSANGS